MEPLSIDLFTGGAQDMEGAQYRILGRLHAIRRAFSRNRVYPYLPELVRLHRSLEEIVQRSRDLENARPRRIRSIDWESKTVIYEPKGPPEDGAFLFEDLILWALPRIREVIEEGGTLCEFFDGHLNIEEVGILPAYVDEGYLLLPDAEGGVLHVIQYQVSIFTGAEQRYRSLKTTHLRAVAQHRVQVSPHSVKLSLVEEFADLPNPATFLFTTDLDLPFAETLLPMAKRKLLRHLAAA